MCPRNSAAAQTTNTWYDADGNEVALTDPDNNQTTWQYDGLGDMTLQTNALPASEQYEYDAAGEVTEKIDADGRATVYSYDGIGRETAENWYASVDSYGNPVGSPTETIAYAYNAAGLLQAASDASASYTYTYDAAGEETSETQQIAGLTPTVSFTDQYTAGNRTQLAASIGGTSDFVDNYQYKSVLGQMSQVTQSGVTGGDAVAQKAVTFTYDNLGELSTISRYANLAKRQHVAQSTYTYDADGNLTSLVYANSGSTLPSYAWTYDPLGNMATSSETLGSINDSTSYTSDSTGQLLTATGTSPSETYSYDSNGNRTNTGYQTGPNNELLCDGTYTYSYDAEGNQTARWVNNNTVSESSPEANDTDITIYAWDNRDRLTSVTHYADYNAYTGTVPYNTPTPDMVVTYAYDLFNRWIGETVTSGGTTTQTRYVYDGNQIVMQFQRTGSGPLAANNLSDRYLWGPAVDQLMADEQLTPVVGGGYDLTSPGTTVWTLTDNENTVRDLAEYSNGTTAVVNHREFSAYGELLSQTNPQTGQAAAVDCVFAYTGRALDVATGLQNNGERWYEAITGRWLSQDPRVFRGGDANLYRYVDNNPLGSVDPTGTQDRPVRLPPVTPPPNQNQGNPNQGTQPLNPNEVRPLPPIWGPPAGYTWAYNPYSKTWVLVALNPITPIITRGCPSGLGAQPDIYYMLPPAGNGSNAGNWPTLPNGISIQGVPGISGYYGGKFQLPNGTDIYIGVKPSIGFGPGGFTKDPCGIGVGVGGKF